MLEVHIRKSITVLCPRCTVAGGSGDNFFSASIWNLITGERLVGPLQHDGRLADIKFSPNGEHIATVVWDSSIRVFDSRDGDPLVTIKTNMPSSWSPLTPLVWSNDGQYFFAASNDRKIKSFDMSTGSQLAESQVHGSDEVMSIALATNGKFLVTFAGYAISFWDTSTLTQIGPVIKDSQIIWLIALSPDCSYLATGGWDGNIMIRNLINILPDLYGPFSVSIYAFTILSDKSYDIFPILSPLGTYSRRSSIEKT